MDGFQYAVVTHLTTRLGVERCLIQDHDTGITCFELINGNAITIQGHHVGFHCHAVITFKTGLRTFIDQRRRHMKFTSSTRLITLTRHGRIKTCLIHVELTFTANIRRQIERETIGVVQLERNITIQHAVFR